MADMKSPSSMRLEGNVAENWAKFKQRFTFYLEATEKTSKPDKTKVALLLGIMGEDCIEIYNNFKLSDEDSQKFDTVIDRFDKHFAPSTNTVIARYKFFNCRQQPSESIDSFINNLKTLAKDCKFEDQEESLVRDLLIMGIKDVNVKEKLLIDSELNLDKAINYCRAKETSQNEIKLMQEGGNSLKTEINAVKYNKKNTKPMGNKDSFKKDTFKKGTKFTKKNDQTKTCQKCLTKHDFGQCPAWGKKCHGCQKLNHFYKACKNKRVQEIVNSDNNSDGETFQLESIVCQVQSQKSEWKETVMVNGDTKVCFKVDSGAEVNILPAKKLNEFKFKVDLSKTNKTLKSYTGHNLKVIGTCKLKCKIGKQSKLLEFYVVDQNANALFGLEASECLGLINRNNFKQVNIISSNDIIKEYQDVN
ncbi:hypothetical protein JTE90_010933 [Oedothorax gibbosus]|uniref:Retrotransposon gag domain-containing protein n=1 Tax=Oedothorax gibbosus TaxID=931172 RepID=A0AAV6TRE6_9ARAC|nr:hypothetical protein JTE90_010933 [Oedothorax gibbosus]